MKRAAITRGVAALPFIYKLTHGVRFFFEEFPFAEHVPECFSTGSAKGNKKEQRNISCM